MPTPNLQAQEFSPIAAPWAEFIGRNQFAPASMSLAWGTADAIVVIDCNFSDFNTTSLSGVIQSCVGSAVRRPPAGGAADGTINRVLPITHPVWPQLVCTRVDKVEFYGPNGKVLSPAGNMANWRNCRLTLHFGSVDYAVLSDTVLDAKHAGDESARFTSGPYVEYNLLGLQRQPGVLTGFKWGADAPAALIGTYLKQGVTQWLPTYRLKLTWRMVPEPSLLNSFGFAVNVNACFGNVNSAIYKGYPIGTLLMQKPKISPVPAPFPLNGNTDLPQRLWDAEINMDYNPTSWQKVPTPKGGFASIQTDDGLGLYPTIDYNDFLFVSL